MRSVRAEFRGPTPPRFLYPLTSSEVTARWLVRFGYDGRDYHGWARQPGHRTIEGEIRRGIAQHGIAATADAAHLEVASRTDRGVSARGNALAIETKLPPAPLLRSMNGISPDLFFTAAREVAPGFRIRGATRRRYRYFQTPEPRSLARWREAAALFAGGIDVRSFSRRLPSGAPARRSVESVTVRPVPGGAEVDVAAPSFVWGMVRKIIGALREVDEERLSLPLLEAALRGEARLTLPMAEPEPLVLWEVEYAEPWTVRWKGPNRHQVRYAEERRNAWVARGRVLGTLEDPPAPSPGAG